MEKHYDSIPRKLNRNTRPPTEAEADTKMSLEKAPAAAGAVAVPGPYPNVNTLLTSGSGVYGYYSDSKRYGLAETIKALRDIAAIWDRRHPGLRFGVGDISKLGGGDIEGHASHEKGVDIDVRPMRDDWAEEPVAYQSGAYSLKHTQELIDLFWANSHLGVQFVFFNDPDTQGTREWPHHDNHFHVRFYEPGQAAAPPVLELGNDLEAPNSELQRCLNIWQRGVDHPGAPLMEDGEYGQRTYERVREFQTTEGLTVDGITGSSTWARLQSWRA